MEGVFFLGAMILTALFVYWSARNDVRRPGTPVSGIFAYGEGREPPELAELQPDDPAAQDPGEAIRHED